MEQRRHSKITALHFLIFEIYQDINEIIDNYVCIGCDLNIKDGIDNDLYFRKLSQELTNEMMFLYHKEGSKKTVETIRKAASQILDAPSGGLKSYRKASLAVYEAHLAIESFMGQLDLFKIYMDNLSNAFQTTNWLMEHYSKKDVILHHEREKEKDIISLKYMVIDYIVNGRPFFREKDGLIQVAHLFYSKMPGFASMTATIEINIQIVNNAPLDNTAFKIIIGSIEKVKSEVQAFIDENKENTDTGTPKTLTDQQAKSDEELYGNNNNNVESEKPFAALSDLKKREPLESNPPLNIIENQNEQNRLPLIDDRDSGKARRIISAIDAYLRKYERIEELLRAYITKKDLFYSVFQDVLYDLSHEVISDIEPFHNETIEIFEAIESSRLYLYKYCSIGFTEIEDIIRFIFKTVKRINQDFNVVCWMVHGLTKDPLRMKDSKFIDVDFSEFLITADGQAKWFSEMNIDDFAELVHPKRRVIRIEDAALLSGTIDELGLRNLVYIEAQTTPQDAKLQTIQPMNNQDNGYGDNKTRVDWKTKDGNNHNSISEKDLAGKTDSPLNSKNSPQVIEIDRNDLKRLEKQKKRGGWNMLVDLINSPDQTRGIQYKSSLHGEKQPDNLQGVLKRRGYKGAANIIHRTGDKIYIEQGYRLEFLKGD